MTKILGLCMALMLMMAVPTTAQTADSLAAADVAAADTTLAATDSLTAGADDLQAIADDETPSFHQMLKTKFIEGNAGFMSLVALALVLGLAFRDPMLALLGATDDTWQYASDFYTLIIVGSPFIIVSTCCAPKATPCSP